MMNQGTEDVQLLVFGKEVAEGCLLRSVSRSKLGLMLTL